MAAHDLVIRGGTVHDGTGADGRPADVAISDGVITEVGEVAGTGSREVDADGALVTPGIVDIHTHYDGQATWDDHLAPSAWHGVTTVVMGNCGVGFAPVHDADHQKLVELMEGVEDIPGAALHEGLDWNWNSFGEFLDALDQRHRDVDCAAQVPHGAVRLHVMGERGAARDDATEADIEAMSALVADGVAAGGLGFTTSRTTNHRTSTGDFTPTLTAASDELVGIARGLGGLGAGVLQVVSDFTEPVDEFTMLNEMMEASGRPMSLTVGVTADGEPGSEQRLLGALAAMNEQGNRITGQIAARPIGLIFGLSCTLHPFMENPVYAEMASAPLAERVARLRRPEVRHALLSAQARGITDKTFGMSLITNFDNIFELADPPDYEPSLADTLAARALAADTTPVEFALDLLLADEGAGLLYLPYMNYVDGSLDALRNMLVHPNTVPGLSDGGAHVGTICDGSFPTTYLSHWGRDRPEGRIPLPYLIQQHCRDTARTVGLLDRGVLAPGYRADVNVIDFDNLGVSRPHLAWDLPAGGRRLLQHASGYLHTFVAGTETYANGEATGALPGRLIRGAQPAPA